MPGNLYERVKCENCEGAGGWMEHAWKTCRPCNGSGYGYREITPATCTHRDGDRELWVIPVMFVIGEWCQADVPRDKMLAASRGNIEAPVRCSRCGAAPEEG